MVDETPRVNETEKYRSLATVLGIVAGICAVGWLLSLRNPIDSNNLSARLSACKTLESAEQNEECLGALDEMQVLLGEYQTVLTSIPASVLESRNAPVVATTTPAINVTATSGTVKLK